MLGEPQRVAAERYAHRRGTIDVGVVAENAGDCISHPISHILLGISRSPEGAMVSNRLPRGEVV